VSAAQSAQAAGRDSERKLTDRQQLAEGDDGRQLALRVIAVDVLHHRGQLAQLGAQVLGPHGLGRAA
jgi:hypothetical protein